MEINEVKPFSKDNVISLKRLKKAEIDEIRDNTIDRIIDYVNGVYEKEITEAIDRDYKVGDIAIRLPFKWRKYTYNNSNDISKALRDKFNPLGFRVYLYGINDGCSCPFDYLCNRDYGVKFYFD